MGIATYSRPENKVSLGFVVGLNNKIRVIHKRAYGLRDEQYLRLKILTSMLRIYEMTHTLTRRPSLFMPLVLKKNNTKGGTIKGRE